MDFLQQLKKTAKEAGNITCLGMDPVLEKIPTKGTVRKRITIFYRNLLYGMKKKGMLPAMVKPNSAFFEQYGFEGLKALHDIITYCHTLKISVLLDAKRGDIGKSSAAYAKAAFEFWQADAITVAPYMGHDSVQPFFDYCSKGKGVYVLCRTSNAGAKDLQDLTVGKVPLFLKVAEHITRGSTPGVGAVVGATYPTELEQISSAFQKSGKEIPLLIPGVGAQGGNAGEVTKILRKTSKDLSIHRINAGSSVCYAYLEAKSTDYVGCAIKALRTFNEEVGF
ncbi:orotidine-5'-phosphate decarboxylase [Candidatus Woesearchaeota archaeon]|nr:orotidine-5'-phosphate decarboxylase [Candidatus Woesearchaeota archaeon]